MEPSAKLIWPVKPPKPARAEARNSRVTPLKVRAILAGEKPSPEGIKATRTWAAVAPGVEKVRVSLAVKAAAWASVRVSKT